MEEKNTQLSVLDNAREKFVITLDRNTMRLYEAMLYEQLKRMIEAVSNPDYVFLINDSDSRRFVIQH